jgi:uncharacterized membrane protein YfcA
MEPIYLYAAIVALLAVVQSIFGMGILVFGTPTLLLLGVDFASVLGWLLPSSMTISLIQVGSGAHQTVNAREKVNMAVCGTAIVIALTTLLQLNLKARIDWLIGLMLLAAAAMRYWPALQSRLAGLLARQERAYIVLMGIVHGLTNMGGALLALYAANAHTDKQLIRATVARYYLMFGTIQLSTLALFKPHALSWHGLLIAPCAALVYLLVGNVLFKRASSAVFERSVTAFIAAYGVVTLARAYL